MWRLDTDTIRYVWTGQCEILDIFQWINGQTAVPSEIDGPIMKRLQVAFRNIFLRLQAAAFSRKKFRNFHIYEAR